MVTVWYTCLSEKKKGDCRLKKNQVRSKWRDPASGLSEFLVSAALCQTTHRVQRRR